MDLVGYCMSLSDTEHFACQNIGLCHSTPTTWHTYKRFFVLVVGHNSAPQPGEYKDE